MAKLRRCFEQAGFDEVMTILSSGNVAFSARASSPATLERKAEAAIAKHLEVQTGGHVHAQSLKSKRRLPIEVDGACILAVKAGEIFTAYVPSARGAVFMQLIERTFGRDVTTRTWDTVGKCAAA